MKLFLMTLLLSVIIFFSGCAIFQPRKAGDSLANLPTTGAQAVFQTLKGNNWLFTLSFIGVGAGFYAFLNGSSNGLKIMAACLIVISLIIGVTKYSAVIAVLAMIGTVCLMIYSTLVKNKALREVVLGVQGVRSELTEKIIEDDSGILSVLDSVQSKATKKIIKKIKDTLKL